MDHSVRNPLPLATVADLEAQANFQELDELPVELRSASDPRNGPQADLIRQRTVHLLILNATLGLAMLGVIVGSLLIGRSVGQYFGSNIVFLLLMAYGVAINLLRCSDVRRQLTHLHLLAIFYLTGAVISLVLGIVYTTQAADRVEVYCEEHLDACSGNIGSLKSAATTMSVFATVLAFTVLLVGMWVVNRLITAIFIGIDPTYSPATARASWSRGQTVAIPGDVSPLLFRIVLVATVFTRPGADCFSIMTTRCATGARSIRDRSCFNRDALVVGCCGCFCFAFIVIMIVAIILCAAGDDVWCTVAYILLQIFVAFLDAIARR